jgi:hypothetical protein
VEVTEVAIAAGYGHAVEVLLVADGLYQSSEVSFEGQHVPHAVRFNYLEVTTDDEKIKIRDHPFPRPTFCFEICVDGIETSVALRSMRY